jgi:hypothetical protein
MQAEDLVRKFRVDPASLNQSQISPLKSKVLPPQLKFANRSASILTISPHHLIWWEHEQEGKGVDSEW